MPHRYSLSKCPIFLQCIAEHKRRRHPDVDVRCIGLFCLRRHLANDDESYSILPTDVRCKYSYVPLLLWHGRLYRTHDDPDRQITCQFGAEIGGLAFPDMTLKFYQMHAKYF